MARRTWPIAVWLIVLTAACSGSPSSPAAPSPTPTPTVISGTLTDTVTGQSLRTFEVSDPPPMRVDLSHPGYVTRTTWILGPDPRVDLFPEAGFDLTFYRQFARGALDGRVEALRLWRQAPALSVQRTGLSDATLAAMHDAARAVIPAFTGGRFQLAGWETWTNVADVGPLQPGWISVELVSQPEDSACGRAEVGGTKITLNVGRCTRPIQDTLAHELGHALGFHHVEDRAALMFGGSIANRTPLPSPKERHHAALAYARQPGNLDIDVDVPQRSTLTPYVVVDSRAFESEHRTRRRGRPVRDRRQSPVTAPARAPASGRVRGSRCRAGPCARGSCASCRR